jgi:hypothetical protein
LLRVCKTGDEGIWHTLGLDREFFLELTHIDEEIARQVAAARCPWCGGPLDRSDFDRKPRGDLFIAADVTLPWRRISFCCRRDSCRRRSTPPSVVFLGRRVYAGAVVIVASALALSWQRAMASQDAAPQRTATQVPLRTLRRWARWWQGELTATSLFAALRGLLASPIETSRLPCSLLERLAGSAVDQLRALLRLLAPLTTGSVSDGARFLRGAGV